MRGPRTSFPLAVTATSGLALASAARSAEFPLPIAAAFAVAALLRLLLGRDGRALLSGVTLGLVAATALGLGSVFLLHSLAGGGGHPLVGLLSLCTAAQAVLLLGRITPFSGFLLVLGASVHLSGAAFLLKDAAAVAWTIATFVSMVWSLVLLERHASVLREDRLEGAVRRLRAGDARTDGAHLRTAGLVAAVASLAGGLLFLALPRVEGILHARMESDDRRASAGSDDPISAIEPYRREAAPAFKTGVDRTASGIRLGDVGRIKADLTPYLAVSSTAAPGELRDLYLRGSALDTFTAGGWYATEGDGRLVRWSDAEDGKRADTWIELEPSEATAGHGLHITFLEGLTARPGGWNLLFLETETVRLRIRQARTSSYAPFVAERADLKRFAPWKLYPGDVLECRVVPPNPTRDALLRARSDRTSAPTAASLQLPPELAPLREISRGIVGNETNPWRRAELLEAWLRRECRYTLNVPSMGDPSTAVLGFVRDVRRGHCEYFASALALMLRSIGHPARVAFGFRGGDLQEDAGAVGRHAIVRGVHAHLWPEMFLQGIGWVRLEPTPPDREALDAATVTQTGRTAEAVEKDAPWWEHLFGFDGDRQRRFWRGLWSAVAGGVGAAVGFLFGPAGLYVGWPLLGLLLFSGVRRERRARRVREALGAGRALPPGVYGDALLLLADHGVRRRRVQTAREFARGTATSVPASLDPLSRITEIYEHERFGGVPAGSAGTEAGASALRELQTALEEHAEP